MWHVAPSLEETNIQTDKVLQNEVFSIPFILQPLFDPLKPQALINSLGKHA